MAGNITCSALNIEGYTESEPIYLDIKCKWIEWQRFVTVVKKNNNQDINAMTFIDSPVCKPGLTRYFSVSRLENVEITCQVEANPSQDLTYKWYFNNSAEMMQVARNRYGAQGPSSVLTYRPVALFDYGTLLCYAANSAGVQAEPCVFHILTAGNMSFFRRLWRDDFIHSLTQVLRNQFLIAPYRITRTTLS